MSGSTVHIRTKNGPVVSTPLPVVEAPTGGGIDLSFSVQIEAMFSEDASPILYPGYEVPTCHVETWNTDDSLVTTSVGSPPLLHLHRAGLWQINWHFEGLNDTGSTVGEEVHAAVVVFHYNSGGSVKATYEIGTQYDRNFTGHNNTSYSMSRSRQVHVEAGDTFSNYVQFVGNVGRYKSVSLNSYVDGFWLRDVPCIIPGGSS